MSNIAKDLQQAFDRLAEECVLPECQRSTDIRLMLVEVQRLRYFEHEVARLLSNSPCYRVESISGISLSESAPLPGETTTERNVEQ